MLKSKKLLIISLNFYPEDTAIGLYSTQLVEFLSKYYEVEVLTAYPYYPKWKIFDSHKNKSGYLKEKQEDYVIHRRKQFIPKKINFSGRVKLMLSFTWNLVRMFFKPNKPDVVFCVIPFTLSCYIGWLYKLLYGSKLWIHVQDFEFDAAIQSGLIKNKWLKWLLLKFESFILNKANRVSTISNGMMKQLKQKTKTSTYFLPNWVHETLININNSKSNHSYFNRDKFSILYSGNIGEKQNWDLFIKLCKRFKDSNQLEFIVVGNGAKKKWLEEETENLNNIKLFDFVPYSELPILLNSTDAHILLQKIEVIDSVMPSKVLGMLASGKPSIIVGNKESELKYVMEKTCNFYFDSYDVIEIQNLIENMISNKIDFQQTNILSKEHIKQHYLKETVLKEFRSEINTI